MLSKSNLQFLGYSVNRLHYEEIESDGAEFSINPQFTRTLKKSGESDYLVEVRVLLEPHEKAPLPFRIDIEIAGQFRIECEDEDLKKQLIEKNTLAILFPYVRSALSSLTLLANIPPLIMPLFDLTKVFEEE